MSLQKPWKKSESGQAPLMIILLGMAFTVGAWTMISTYTSVESNLDIRAQDERLHLEQVLMDNTNCADTMAQIGLTDAASITEKCTTSFSDQTTGITNPTFVPLINSDGDIVTESFDNSAGKKYGKSGNWSFRAGCFASGATTCLLVHSAKPWEGPTDPQNQFQPRALLGREESWKKLPNSPWPNCCWGPPSCRLFVSPDPVARDNTVTFTMVTTNASSATMSTSDSRIPAGTPFPLSPGILTTTHLVTGAKTATAVVVGPGGTSSCSVSYLVVDPPLCDLTITTPAAVGGIHQVTSGQPVTLSLTWTNSSSVESTPTLAEIVAFNMPPSPEVQLPLSIAFPVPTSGVPTQTLSVVPPVGRTDQGIAGFRGKYVAALRNATGSSFCETTNVAAICPLSTPVGFYEYLSPPVNCTTCDRADYFNPGAPYTVMTHGFSVASNSSQFPNLQTVFQQYSASRADFWTSVTNQGSVLEDYNMPPTPLFYAYNNSNEAPGLIPIRTMTKTHPATAQDQFVFPADSRYAANIAAYQGQGYTQGATNEFHACPVPGNYNPVVQSPGAGPGPGPGAPGPGAPGPSSPGPGPGPSGGCRGSLPPVYDANISACGSTQNCVGVSTMREFWDAVCDNAQCIYLKNNLNGADVQWTCGCSSPMAPRTLDGKGFSIVGFNGKTTSASSWHSSLFEYTGLGTTRFCNLTMQNINLTSNVASWNGMLAGFVNSTSGIGTTFYGDNLHVTGTIGPARMVAGIFGAPGFTIGGANVNLTNSTVSATLIGNVVGGAVATARGGNVQLDAVNVSSNITVAGGQVPGWTQLSSGGLVGDANFGGTAANIEIRNSRYSGTMTLFPGTSTIAAYGGLVGSESSAPLAIYDSLFSGTINGGTVQAVGGIAGRAGCNTTMTNVASTGSIATPNSANVGGVFGEQRADSLRNYINVTSSTNVSGSSCTGSAYGAAKTINSHTGVVATGSATGGSSNAVNANTGCAPVSSIACP